MATRGAKRRRARRAARRNGPEKTYLGGSQQEQKDLQADALHEKNRSRMGADESRGEVKDALDATRSAADTESNRASQDRQTAQSSRYQYQNGIRSIGAAGGFANMTRSSALNSNQLTGTAEDVLAKRKAELAGVPTIGQATDTAIQANQANANSMLQNQIAQQNRAARGLAGSMGEGGALAMQQAVASAGAGAADQAAASQLQQGQLAAQMRFGAAQTQNQQDYDSANLGANYRMGAAEQERQNQMSVANANAGTLYDSALQEQAARGALMGQDANTSQATSQRSLGALGMANDMAGNLATLDQNRLGMANQDQQFNLGANAGLSQSNSQNAYASAMANSPMAKLKNVFGGLTTVSGGLKQVGQDASPLNLLK